MMFMAGSPQYDVSDFASAMIQVTIDDISTGTRTVTITATPAGPTCPKWLAHELNHPAGNDWVDASF